MTSPKRGWWFAAAGSLGAIAITAGTTYGVLSIAGAGGDRYAEESIDGTDQPNNTGPVAAADDGSTATGKRGVAQGAPNVQRVEGLLETANRDRLAFCVQERGVAEGTAALTSTAILGIWPQILADPRYLWLDIPESPPLVELGCPQDPAYYDPDAGPLFDESLFLTQGYRVSTPSYYRFFVFILPQAELEAITQGGAQWASQELLCWGDQCTEVTAAIFLGEDDVLNANRLLGVIEYAMGLK